jgi:lipoprotein-anchoring transpeptidase ErfK/SrfK
MLGVRVVLAGAALAVPVAAGCGNDDEVPASAPNVVAAQEDASPEAASDDESLARGSRSGSADPLLLPDVGNPLVQVRRNRRVDLYDEPGGSVIKTVRDETEFGSPTAFAVLRERDDWAGVPTPHFENGRLAWVRLDSRRLKAYTVFYEVEVDLSEYTTTLLRRDKPIRTFPVSIGRPEAPTPTGEFAVTDTFRGGLNPAYGCCAVALTARQTRLPSGWLGGDRIAIHGTSGTLGAPISTGCVRAEDENVSELVDRLPPGTPVTIQQ